MRQIKASQNLRRTFRLLNSRWNVKIGTFSRDGKPFGNRVLLRKTFFFSCSYDFIMYVCVSLPYFAPLIFSGRFFAPLEKSAAIWKCTHHPFRNKRTNRNEAIKMKQRVKRAQKWEEHSYSGGRLYLPQKTAMMRNNAVARTRARARTHWLFSHSDLYGYNVCIRCSMK